MSEPVGHAHLDTEVDGRRLVMDASLNLDLAVVLVNGEACVAHPRWMDRATLARLRDRIDDVLAGWPNE